MKKVMFFALIMAAACGAAQKVESGGEQMDRAVDRDSPKLEREVNGLLYADAGKDAPGNR